MYKKADMFALGNILFVLLCRNIFVSGVSVLSPYYCDIITMMVAHWCGTLDVSSVGLWSVNALLGLQNTFCT